MTTLTRTIAGHEITLARGRRYLASRPFCGPGPIKRQTFDVTIADITDGVRIDAHPAAIVESLGYDDANEFLSCFNSDGPTSHAGRMWR